MYQFSDSESSDSEDGIRFKTDSTRNKVNNKIRKEQANVDYKRHSKLQERHSSSKRRSLSPRYRRDVYRKPSDRRSAGSSYSKSRSRSPKRKSKKHKKESYKKDSDVEVKSSMPIKVDKCKKEIDQLVNKHKYEDVCSLVENKTTNNSVSSIKSLQNEDSVVLNKHDAFGPILPPHLVNKETPEVSKIVPDLKNNEILTESFEPVLPHTTSLKSNKLTTELGNETDEIGPTLPPLNEVKNALEEDSNIYNTIGPDLPQHLRESLAKLANESMTEKETDAEDDDVYGPLPSGTIANSKAQIALEERALKMKIDHLNPKNDDKVGREEWMLELPQVRASSLGLGPRQFRANPTPDLSDRSSWTDTPEDKAKKLLGKCETKVNLKKEAESRELERRDQEQEEIIRKHKKKKKEKSLLQLHQDDMKKKKDDEGPSVRRPFNRDIDLKVNHFDEAQKKAVLKKAQLLDDRFSSGQAKFL